MTVSGGEDAVAPEVHGDLDTALVLVRRELARAEQELEIAQQKVENLRHAERDLGAANGRSRRWLEPPASEDDGDYTFGSKSWSMIAQLGSNTDADPDVPPTSWAVRQCLEDVGEPMSADDLVRELLGRRWLRLDVAAPRDMVYQAALRLAETHASVTRPGRGLFQYVSEASARAASHDDGRDS